MRNKREELKKMVVELDDLMSCYPVHILWIWLALPSMAFGL